MRVLLCGYHEAGCLKVKTIEGYDQAISGIDVRSGERGGEGRGLTGMTAGPSFEERGIPMRVVINAQLDPRRSGGIAQVIMGLAHGLGRLDGPEEYLFVCSPESADWLGPYLEGRCRIAVNRKRTPSPVGGVRQSDGFWESFAPDVLHFPYQSYTETSLPTVFNPHDLQHVHLPELFTEEERTRREALYSRACRSAAAVAVASEYVRNDVVETYGISPEKTGVICWGSPSVTRRRPDGQEVKALLYKHRLPNDFAIYPAQTWPHKNHKLLLRALELLRAEKNLRIPLVCTGAKTEHFAELAHEVKRLKLDDQVRFLGWIDECDLMALYQAAKMMVVPTLFEAASFAVLEAFAEGIPVACSTVTSLPEQVGDAALLFDPHDVEGLASAVERLDKDSALRELLVRRGRRRLRSFSWRTTAEEYRALYREISGRQSLERDVGERALA